MSNAGPFRGSRAANKQTAPQQDDAPAPVRRRQASIDEQPEIIEETFVKEPVSAAPIAPRQDTRQEQAAVYNQPVSQGPKSPRLGSKNRIFGTIGTILVILLVVAGIVWAVAQLNRTGVDSTKYQGVFLTNGELYIGKFKPLNGKFIELTDVYYLKSATDTNAESAQQQTDLNKDNVQLIKFGDEVHGPEDKMIIATDKIIHYENLKANGKAVEAIARYKQSNK